jgi:hypothetical protein
MMPLSLWFDYVGDLAEAGFGRSEIVVQARSRAGSTEEVLVGHTPKRAVRGAVLLASESLNNVRGEAWGGPYYRGCVGWRPWP